MNSGGTEFTSAYAGRRSPWSLSLGRPRAALMLAPAMACLIAAQIWAGLSLRGLYADGAFYAARLWLGHGFFIMEPARFTAQFLVQIPVVLGLHLGASSPLAVATAFSLATNLTPLLLLGGAALALPRAARAWALVPVLVFLCFGMAASIASIGDGNTAAAYAWMLLLLLLFGGSGRGTRLLILLLALGALRLYEAMAFLGPLLLLAAMWRHQQVKASKGDAARPLRLTLRVAIILLIAGSLISLHDLAFPRLPGNRASLLADLLSCRWLWAGHEANALGWLGLLGLLCLPVIWLEGRARAWGWGIMLVAFALATACALWLPLAPAASFAARSNFCLASAPAMLAVLLARSWRIPAAEAAAILPLASLLALSLSLADLGATQAWLGYQGAMRSVLQEEHGIIPWAEALHDLPSGKARKAFEEYSWPWSTPLMSLWFTPQGGLTSLVANTPGSGWEPFPPAILRPLLSPAAPPAPTRADALRDAFPLAR